MAEVVEEVEEKEVVVVEEVVVEEVVVEEVVVEEVVVEEVVVVEEEDGVEAEEVHSSPVLVMLKSVESQLHLLSRATKHSWVQLLLHLYPLIEI